MNDLSPGYWKAMSYRPVGEGTTIDLVRDCRPRARVRSVYDPGGTSGKTNSPRVLVRVVPRRWPPESVSSTQALATSTGFALVSLTTPPTWTIASAPPGSPMIEYS